MKMKLIEIVKPFICSEDTCDEVRDYFESGNDPKGPYIHLAKYFIDDTYPIHSKYDADYKNWLKELIEDEKENESIILDALKKDYQNKEDLKKFVFLLDNMSPELNQKWHFFISYWGYREYVTREYFARRNECDNPNKSDDPKQIGGVTLLDKEYVAMEGNPFSKCPEGKLWYECMVKRK